MIETNLRIVDGGPDLEEWTRRLIVSGSDVTPDRLERACGVLRYRHGLAAIPLRGDAQAVLVAHRGPVATVRLEDQNWEIALTDSGDSSQPLRFGDADAREMMALLIERRLLAALARNTALWTLDSPRIWYEPEPFHEEGDIRVFRRYRISTLPIDGVGIGVAVDVSRAFFTAQPIGYFFDEQIAPDERRRRSRRFDALVQRQSGQKGTLLYDNGENRVKCYLEQPPSGETCGTTGRIRIKGHSYDSLAAYYEARCPRLGDTREHAVARVAFMKLGVQPVSANRLWARVMNDDLPERLKRMDKLPPADRRAEIDEFWRLLGSRNPVALFPGFWQPARSLVRRFHPVNLEFGSGLRLESKNEDGVQAVREHFRERERFLRKGRCFEVPVATNRRIYVAYPKRCKDAGQRLADDVAGLMSSLTGLVFEAEAVEYDTSVDGSERVGQLARAGMALFVMDHEPEVYYDVAYRLRGWRVKRVTEVTLTRYFADLTEGAVDRKTGARSLERGQRRWDQFVQMTVLDVLQQLDVVLWRIDRAGAYDAQIIIDVGHDRRHVALSILVARSHEMRPSFKLSTNVQAKADHQFETINPRLLNDQLVALVETAIPVGGNALQSLVIFRDGRVAGREAEGIRGALERLRESSRLSANARVDLIDVHKDTLKGLRLWNVSTRGEITNVLEGTAVQLGKHMALLATTGEATLPQGTAQPLLLVDADEGANGADAAEAFSAGSHLNWSSPAVAQQCSLPLKRTDDELKARSAQEVRRLR